MAAPGFPNQTIKLVELPIGKEIHEEDDWILNEVHSIDHERGVFYGLMLKRDQTYLDGIKAAKEAQAAKAGVREGKEFEIPEK